MSDEYEAMDDLEATEELYRIAADLNDMLSVLHAREHLHVVRDLITRRGTGAPHLMVSVFTKIKIRKEEV